MTVAILDSGFVLTQELREFEGRDRLLNRYNAITDVEHKGLDKHGHGTHVASIILNQSRPISDPDKYNSIAPAADVVAVKAFGTDGSGTYANVIRGLDWIVANKETYGIRVLNLSFSAPPQSYYWEDPVNQAVMAAWDAGIVVVTSSGNTGPDPRTIGVPGNVPYVITVGAMTDSYTPEDTSNDKLARFSSAGPTHEGFVKPEIVAPAVTWLR